MDDFEGALASAREYIAASNYWRDSAAAKRMGVDHEVFVQVRDRLVRDRVLQKRVDQLGRRKIMRLSAG